MLSPADERIRISPSVHSISVQRDVTTPGYKFPNEGLFDYQKPFLAAGMRGLGGCGACGGLGGTSISTLVMIGLAAAFFLLPPKMRL